MPVQRTFFGTPIPHVPPRRMAVLLGTIAVFAVITLVFTLPNSIPSGPSLGKFTDHRMSLPKLPKQLPSPSILNPFRQAAHAPPVQKNSEYGESKWHANWNWLSPFSSSVTLDENRSLLPPLVERPTIYTYYDHTIEKDNELKDAENAVLVTWRRAWWAQGFKPIILSPAEAMNNPLYPELQRLEVENSLKTDLTRWLAWENMGTGLLCNYLTLPMGPYEDQTLSYLRRGVYPLLTRYEKMGSGIFAGSKADITAAVKVALANPSLKDAKDFISAVPTDTFEIDPSHDSLAFYQTKTLEEKYPQVAKEYEGNKAAGMKLLNNLMVSHLHQTWQNIFTKGISVVKPEPEHMSYVVEPALQLAEYLAQCPDSPMPASCPPNRPKCKPCVASSPMTITTPAFYRNTSGLYTIGTVPHPYTMSTLTSFQESIDVPWIRRESPRDAWLSTLTKELLGTGVSGTPRIIKFKEAVASPHGTSHSLWLTAEKEVPSDLDWHFGFTIPRNATDTGKSETPVPGPERRPKPVHDPKDGPIPTEEDKNKEALLLEKAKAFGGSTAKEDLKIRGAVEAWNLADTEAWRFARAFLARSRVERIKWEEEEKKYAGGAGAERGKESGWGRWFDDK
ncbi:hypothetical protein BELL_0110g00080 [Botrytis elliptica]|uniref:Uncharacterized protein n=1 Tax=Botrytis elliptica TaxID=278938 RepID=A0A4Z1JUR3_9HELO|nr:hypothetical protein EAE99_011047 [Botrytis elliptica]TGO77385.1 hypothetical protein BELL_0110g00080 [Botrytis elliptica]